MVYLVLTAQEKKWLRQRYQGLKYAPKSVSGTIQFVAIYNNQTNKFTILKEEENFEGKQGCLSGMFRIKIKERSDKSLFRLPALYVDDVELNMSRHFNQSDKSACLISPIEEENFLFPKFEFQTFLEHLVIPFLYGQLFYSNHNRWPWEEYDHGSVGLLESYSKTCDFSKARECLDKLTRQDKGAWPKIKLILLQKSDIKGHMPCFCRKEDHIRRCHPNAWKGIIKLKKDLLRMKIEISE